MRQYSFVFVVVGILIVIVILIAIVILISIFCGFFRGNHSKFFTSSISFISVHFAVIAVTTFGAFFSTLHCGSSLSRPVHLIVALPIPFLLTISDVDCHYSFPFSSSKPCAATASLLLQLSLLALLSSLSLGT